MPYAARGTGIPVATPVDESVAIPLEVAPDDVSLSTENPFDEEAVACLSDLEIRGLDDQKLADVIRAGRFPFFVTNVEGRLDHQTRDLLERLAFRARECCKRRRISDPLTPQQQITEWYW